MGGDACCSASWPLIRSGSADLCQETAAATGIGDAAAWDNAALRTGTVQAVYSSRSSTTKRNVYAVSQEKQSNGHFSTSCKQQSLEENRWWGF